ncbi:endonuclease [Thioalkalicoccus limnaeus]|uniref:Endonuclease n=1 Tax=Thioalkalicoccus limnaeus TaxID=120681 RepID=A0ABV4BIY4_9GAMM
MPRRPTKKPRARTTRAKAARPGRLRRLITPVILLTPVLAVSWLPASLITDWPEHGQRAVAIARDIRELLTDLVRDTGHGAWNGVTAITELSLADLGGDVSDWVAHRWPLGTSGPAPDGLPRVAESFSSTRGLLYDTVYSGRWTTFYCGCPFDRDGRTDLARCGIESLAGQARAGRVEAEHVFPASQFGHYRPCWRDPGTFPECTTGSGRLSGRACCERVDPVFTAAYNDLHNLVPAVGAINAARSNHNWGRLSSGQTFNPCEIRIDAGLRRVEPPAAVRGDIARIMFYMRDTYGFRLSRQDEQLFAAWNNLDPPDAWEIERNRRIRRLQGAGNPYVERYQRM